MKKRGYIFVFFLLSLGWATESCSGEKEDVYPEERQETSNSDAATNSTLIKTTILTISNITTTTATIEGEIESNNRSLITERGVAWSTEDEGEPSMEGNYARASLVMGDGTFKVELTNLKQNTVYQIRPYVRSKKEVIYGDIKTFTTLKINDLKVRLNPVYAAGTIVSFVSAQVTSQKGGHIEDKGVCWDENNSPVITHSNSKSFGEGFGTFFGKIDNLKPDTRYRLRAYAITNTDTIYSDNQITLQTISEGNVTYFLHKKEDPSEEEKEAYKRIEVAFDTAVFYLNKFTSVTKHLDISYSPGTPTADGNINGHINIGANAAYQRAGTVLHEIAHTLGVGTTWQWGDQLIDGIYQGIQATTMLQFMTQDSTAELHGDRQHFWPYGINGEWEDTGEDMLYIIHCLIIQGMVKDGLPIE